MYVIIAYDVNAARTQILKKICQQFLGRVQNSVFEGKLTVAQFRELKDKLTDNINKDEMLRIWEIADNQIMKIHTLGTPRIEEGNVL